MVLLSITSTSSITITSIRLLLLTKGNMAHGITLSELVVQFEPRFT